MAKQKLEPRLSECQSSGFFTWPGCMQMNKQSLWWWRVALGRYVDAILNYHVSPVNIYGFKTGSSRKRAVLTPCSKSAVSLWSSPSLKPFYWCLQHRMKERRDKREHHTLSLLDFNVFIPENKVTVVYLLNQHPLGLFSSGTSSVWRLVLTPTPLQFEWHRSPYAHSEHTAPCLWHCNIIFKWNILNTKV